MLPILNIGPLALQTPLLVLLIGLWFAITLVEKEAERSGLSVQDVSNLVLVLTGGLIAGGRLVYVMQHFERYVDAPLGIILPNPNTLMLVEGAVLAVVAGIIFAQRKNLPLWETMDVLVPSAAVMMIAAAGMHLASGEAYGTLSSVPWAVDLRGGMRHPVQAYEMVLYGIVFLVLLRWRPAAPGARFAAGAAMLAAARMIAEGFRADALTLDGWRTAQIAALAVALAALMLLRNRILKEAEQS